MTSVFELLSNEETWQSEAQAKATIQNMHQEMLDHTNYEKKLSTIRPTTHRYFVICHACFWCASYIGTMDIMKELPFEMCPTCNDNKFESLPILYDESYRYESINNLGRGNLIFPVWQVNSPLVRSVMV